jgi:predicted permease
VIRPGIRRFLRLAVRRPPWRAGEVDDEIRFHLEERAEQLVRELGLTPAEARAEALRRFGGLREARPRLIAAALQRETHMRRAELLDTVRQDLTYAARQLRRSPGFAVAAVTTLALGIGANTAMFSVVNGVLLRPLPYADADRVVVVWNRWTSWPKTWLSGPEVVDYARQRDVFDGLAAFDYTAANLSGDRGEPERVRVGLIARELLDVVGVHPALGRGFAQEEDAPNGAQAVLLSDDLWRRRYGADRSVIGTRVAINGIPQTVVGVLPAGFRLPIEFAGEHSQLYMPLRLVADEGNRGSHGLYAVARLRPGVSAEAAERRMNAFIQRFRQDHPNSYGPDFGVVLVPVRDEVLGNVRRILLVLLGAVSFVLLIGCANIANLLLSRAESRHREVAIRAALGAGRGRLVRQLLTESVVLGLLGGALGLAIARAGIVALGALGPANLPRVGEVALDPWVLAYTLGVSLACGFAFGLAPAVHAARGDLHHSLRQGRGTTSAGRQRLRHLLVAGEVALAVVSVTGATLMARSFTSLLRVPPGFRTDHALTMRLSLPAGRYATSSRVRDAYDGLLSDIRRLPGVRSAGAIMALPLAVTLGDWSFSIEGKAPPPPGHQGAAADWQVATPGYFEAMGIPLRRGRLLAPEDRLPGRAVIVINETTARRYWPGEDPIGKRLRLGGDVDTLYREIVGVIGDVKHKGVDQETRAEMYLPHAQFPSALPDSAGAAARSMTLVIRTDRDPARLTAAVRAIVGRMDPELPIAQVRTLGDVFSASVSTPRFTTVLLAAFGGLALVLAALGVYGVISYSVAQRSQEMGIRMALGARAADVVRLVVVQGMRPAVVGLVLGVFAAIVGTRLMRQFLFGVSETDAASFVAGVVVLGVAGLVATVIPARRATRADPVMALRAD